MNGSEQGREEALGPGISSLLGAVRAQFLLATLTGIVLAIGYSPQTGTAHAQVAAMHAGWIRPVQALHYWGCALLILESVLLLVLLLWTGRYKRGDWMTLAASTLFAVSAFLFQVTGNLLPYDRHGVETAVIEAGIAARAPGVGALAQKLVLQGPEFGPATLRFWYALHMALVALPALAFVLDYKGRRAISSRLDPRAVTGICSIPVLLALFVPSPLGSAATALDGSTFGDKPSWYTWPLHGSMALFDRISLGSGWIGAMLLPALIVLGVLSLPLWGSKVSVWAIRSGVIVVSLFFLGAGVFFAGSFDPLIGTRDPAPLPVASKTGAVTPIDKMLASKGQADFQSAGCAGCHGPNGDTGGGGPSLKTIGQQYPEPDFYMKYIHSPTSVNPQATMPPFPNLGQDELRALAEFLRGKGR